MSYLKQTKKKVLLLPKIKRVTGGYFLSKMSFFSKKERENFVFKSKCLFLLVVEIFVFNFFFLIEPVFAQEPQESQNNEVLFFPVKNLDLALDQAKIVNHLPKTSDYGVHYTLETTITAYNSEPEQCDDSPCITANGFNVCEHGEEDTIATNFLPFGTKIRIPDLFGDRVFIVRDRMNKRFKYRVDIWMIEKNEAKKFGIKQATIEILK